MNYRVTFSAQVYRDALHEAILYNILVKSGVIIIAIVPGKFVEKFQCYDLYLKIRCKRMI